MENVIIERVAANPRYDIAARSHIGGRAEQQDRACICCDERRIFALICDGMGGAADGGIASEAALAAMRQAYQEYLDHQDDESPSAFLYRAMGLADRNVSRKIEYRAGGTTLVAALIQDGLLFWLSVGDSRLYILRSGELLQVTRDHNYFLRLEELKSQGTISDAQYKKEAERGEALISYIGQGEITLFDLTRTGLALQSGDKLLLATDGLFKVIQPARMQRAMEESCGISARADLLLKQVLEEHDRAALDNTTFIMIDTL